MKRLFGRTRHLDVKRSITASSLDTVVEQVDKATRWDTVVLHITSSGGITSSAYSLIKAIQTTEARVVAKVSVECASAAAMILIRCDEVIMDGDTRVLFHYPRIPASAGGVHVLVPSDAKAKPYHEELAYFTAEFKRLVRSGVLTHQEFFALNDEQDVVMTGAEYIRRGV